MLTNLPRLFLRREREGRRVEEGEGRRRFDEERAEGRRVEEAEGRREEG
jgi:hypothetical protein